jgi:broad specificity phosphatase PhoE
MTTFLLIRHGSNDVSGRGLAGRAPGVHLNEVGRREAERLADQLSSKGIQHIVSSPMERCLETAAPLARRLNLQVLVANALTEMDFGDWTGKPFAELDSNSDWKRWNACRTLGQTPGGETMLTAQARVVGELQRLRGSFPDHCVAVFSHCDPLRAALCYYLGIPLDFLRRLELRPASVTALLMDDWNVQVRSLGREILELE